MKKFVVVEEKEIINRQHKKFYLVRMSKDSITFETLARCENILDAENIKNALQLQYVICKEVKISHLILGS